MFILIAVTVQSSGTPPGTLQLLVNIMQLLHNYIVTDGYCIHKLLEYFISTKINLLGSYRSKASSQTVVKASEVVMLCPTIILMYSC